MDDSLPFGMNPSVLTPLPPSTPAAPPRVDCVLAQRAAKGDEAAFAQLTERYRKRLYSLTRSMVATSADAEEVVQETFLSIYRALGTLQIPQADSMLSAWIFRVGVNAALMHLRRHRRRPILHLEDLAHGAEERSSGLWPSSSQRPDESLMHGELKDRLHQAMGALPDKYRLVLWLRDIEEQSNDEVAQTLGLTVPTVKARLHRARSVVRDALAVYLGGTESPAQKRV
jgi:RNA polymerase sigma-70 factor (ECF subfamily)